MDAISVLSFKVDVWSRAGYIQVFHFVVLAVLCVLQLLASGFTLLLGDRETNFFSHKSALYFLSQSKGVSALNWFLFSKIDVEFLDKQLPTLLYFTEH